MKEKKWTVCTLHFGKVKKWAQYADKARAEAHAKSNGIGWFVSLYPVNPQRTVKVGGRRSIACYRKGGLPQY